MPAGGPCCIMSTAMTISINRKISKPLPGLCSGDMEYFSGNWQNVRTWHHPGEILFAYFEPLKPGGKSGADVLWKVIMASNSVYQKLLWSLEMLKNKISKMCSSPSVPPTR